MWWCAAQDAWPQLCLLLARGPNVPLGAEAAAAPGLVQRTQAAVLDCLIRRPLTLFILLLAHPFLVCCWLKLHRSSHVITLSESQKQC